MRLCDILPQFWDVGSDVSFSYSSTLSQCICQCLAWSEGLGEGEVGGCNLKSVMCLGVNHAARGDCHGRPFQSVASRSVHQWIRSLLSGIPPLEIGLDFTCPFPRDGFSSGWVTRGFGQGNPFVTKRFGHREDKQHPLLFVVCCPAATRVRG